MKTTHKVLISAAVLAFVFGLGYWRGNSATTPSLPIQEGAHETHGQVWTCSMHPTIRESAPGKCSICGMALIPVATDQSDEDGGATQLKLSAKAQKLAEIQVAPVERKFVTAEIRMVGKVTYDERGVDHITAWVPGRIDRLFADYTGIPVRKGDHMVELFSPELLTTQQELIQAIKTAEQTNESGLSTFRATAKQTVDSVRERLRLWGMTAEQIAQIEQRGTASDHMTIYAPIGGIVIDMPVRQGMYVKTGTRIYTIADLSHVWVKFDAYESDLAWLRYGQEVEFQTESYPGEVFTGKIAFMDPMVNAKTRTVKVRVNVGNPHGKLKPEMFVRAVVSAKLTEQGNVLESDLAGKWISPMHPEIVKDVPGNCDVCGMPLVRAETLGYAAGDTTEKQAPLVIPASAPLITGKRAVVYIALPDQEGMYQGREVVLGPRAGEYYVVRQGLSEGEQVVVNGNFKIDSAVQLLAKPSMMNPQAASDEQTKTAESYQAITIPDALQAQLADLFTAYLDIHKALSHDSLSDAQGATKRFLDVLNNLDMTGLTGEAHSELMAEHGNLKKIITPMLVTDDIERSRQGFAMLSESMIVLTRKFGKGSSGEIMRFHCPMAFANRGADWLQDKPEVQNPYFGSAMFRCGSQVETIK